MSVKSLTLLAVLVALVCGVVLLRDRDGSSPSGEVVPPSAAQDNAPGEPASPAATEPRSPAAEREQVAPERADQPAAAEPTPPPIGLTVRGRVLSPGGEGVAGATVCTGSLAALEELLAGGEPAEALGVARTDGVGRFRLEGLEAGVLRLVAGRQGSAPSEERVLELGAALEDEEVLLVLRAGARIHGEVLRIDGAPMRGASLRLLQQETESMRLGATDGEGRFDERNLNPGEWELVCFPDASIVEGLGGSFVDHLSQKTVTVEDGQELFVSLGGPPPPGVRVHGRVTQGGAAVQGQLHWMAEGAASASNQKLHPSEADGSFEVELTRPGPWFVKVSGGHGHQEFRVDVPAAREHELDFALPGGALAGVVVDEDDRPLPGVRLSLYLEEGTEYRHDMSGMQDQRFTADDGSFEYGCLAPGRYLIAAEDEGGEHALAALRDLWLAEGQELRDLRLVLGVGHRIAGRVTDSRGLPVAAAPIWIYDAEGQLLNPITTASSDAEGTFLTGPLPVGEYTLHCRSEDEAALTDELVRIQDRDVQVNLALQPGAELSVTVLGPDGDALRAQVRVDDSEGRVLTGLRDRHHPWAWQRHGLDSRLDRVGPLPPGSYVVTAAVPGLGTTFHTLSLEPGESRELQLQLE